MHDEFDCKPEHNLGHNELSVGRRHFLAGSAALVTALAFATRGAFAQGEPTPGGILRLAQSSDAQPRNALASRAGNNQWRHQVFDCLTVLDSETGQPVPQLATSWEARDGGETMVFTLRDGVKFHTGRAFTAEDAVFTLEQIKVPENASQMAPIVNKFTSIEATGPLELTITADRSIETQIFDVLQLAVIVDKDTFAGLADGSQVVGTGPFKWVQWTPGASLTLEKNQDYWLEGRPYLDGIDISIITDPTALASSIRGRVDVAFEITPRDLVMFRNDPSIDVFEAAGGNIYPLGINVMAAPFDNKALRQAIGYAIDRQRIIDQVLNGVGDTSCLWWRSNVPGTTPEMVNHYSYDPDKARQLIAEAGAEGVTVPINVIAVPTVQAIYEIVQNNLREVGLNPQGNIMETAAFDQAQTAGDLGAVFQQIHGLQGFSAATIVDALPALRDTNPSKFTPPRYRELKDNLQAATADSAPAALAELAEFMLDEAFSHIMVHSRAPNVKTKMVHGIVFTNVGFVMMSDAWIG